MAIPLSPRECVLVVMPIAGADYAVILLADVSARDPDCDVSN